MGKAVHDIQQDKDFDGEWSNINTEEDENIDVVTIKSLNFNTIRSVIT